MGNPIIVDLSHWNEVASWSDFVARGVFGIVHKATQGIGYCDSFYRERQMAAQTAGLAWGAYHFGTAGNVPGQVEWFLRNANPHNDMLLALDWERNTFGPSMGLPDAERWVTLVQMRLVRWPVVYTGAWWLKDLNIKPADLANSALGNCPLWIACYGCKAPIIPPPWKDYALWQFTDGSKNISRGGDLPGEDQSRFNGDEGKLRAWWCGGMVV